MPDYAASAELERFAFEKGGTRGGSTAPPGPKRVEKRGVVARFGPYAFETHSVSI